eukprot:1860863-Amphidinium_carterae.2
MAVDLARWYSSKGPNKLRNQSFVKRNVSIAVQTVVLWVVTEAYFLGTPVLNFVYRLLGARIGKDVIINTKEVSFSKSPGLLI